MGTFLLHNEALFYGVTLGCFGAVICGESYLVKKRVEPCPKKKANSELYKYMLRAFDNDFGTCCP
eukprot:2389861-Amphidinium_carterae.2